MAASVSVLVYFNPWEESNSSKDQRPLSSSAPDQPFFSRGTNRLLLLVGQLCRTVSFVVGEQFLGVSSCFVQCFVHNKHPSVRRPVLDKHPSVRRPVESSQASVLRHHTHRRSKELSQRQFETAQLTLHFATTICHFLMTVRWQLRGAEPCFFHAPRASRHVAVPEIRKFPEIPLHWVPHSVQNCGANLK